MWFHLWVSYSVGILLQNGAVRYNMVQWDSVWLLCRYMGDPSRYTWITILQWIMVRKAGIWESWRTDSSGLQSENLSPSSLQLLDFIYKSFRRSVYEIQWCLKFCQLPTPFEKDDGSALKFASSLHSVYILIQLFYIWSQHFSFVLLVLSALTSLFNWKN